MTEEEKLYYETLLEEKRDELLNLIKRLNITIFKLTKMSRRPIIRNTEDDAYGVDTLDVWFGTFKIYIDQFGQKKYDELFELHYLPETDGKHRSEVYKLFCTFFKNLVEENNKCYQKQPN